MQTLKSVQASRIDPGKAFNSAGHRENLGEGLFCPAGAGGLHHDVYGRPADQNTLGTADGFFTLEPACPQYTKFSASRMIQVENNQRPYLPTAAAGLRGAADLMGRGRHRIGQNVYGEGHRGDFVRHYNTHNDAPDDPPDYLWRPTTYRLRVEQPYDYSHSSAEKSVYFAI